MSWIVLEKVGKRFGNKWTISELDLRIEKGEFFTLLGPSGCGKTTTLRLIAGLELADAGKIFIGGKDVTKVAPQERRVAMVFQNYALYPHMSIAENIAYPLKVRGFSRKEQEARVREKAERLKIGHLLDRMPNMISGGEQQRVAVARAMVQEPNVFLFDEPLSNLDARLRLEARRFLRKIQKELGVTTVYVTHDQAEAMAMSDRVAVMKEGKLVQVGSPEEIYSKPADIFVASFVGNLPMNFLKGYAEKHEGKWCFYSDDLKVWLPQALPLTPREELTLGIRPEHIELSTEPDLGEESMAGNIDDIEPLGSEQILSISVLGKTLLVRDTKRGGYRLGNRVFLKIPFLSLCLFNSQGKRIG